MKGATLQSRGVVPSFTRPAVSNDNPYSESLFSTLKGHPSFPDQPFADLEEARRWTQEFARWYDTEYRYSGLEFATPTQRHRGEDIDCWLSATPSTGRPGPNIPNAGAGGRGHALLRIQAQLDDSTYAAEIKVSNRELAALAIERDEFHGEWNYRLEPRGQANGVGIVQIIFATVLRFISNRSAGHSVLFH